MSVLTGKNNIITKQLIKLQFFDTRLTTDEKTDFKRISD